MSAGAGVTWSSREAAQSVAGRNAAAGIAWSKVRLFTAGILAEVEYLNALWNHGCAVCLLNEGIGCDKGHRGHTKLDLGALASQNSLGTLEGFAAEQGHMFASDLD